MKVLLVGSGGREHAIAMAIKKSGEEPTLYAAMRYKNPGIARLCEGYRIVNETDVEKVTEYARSADLVVIGPEAVSYTHLRAHETDSYLVCRLLLEKKKKK